MEIIMAQKWKLKNVEKIAETQAWAGSGGWKARPAAWTSQSASKILALA